MFGWFRKKREPTPPNIGKPVREIVASVENEPDRWSFTHERGEVRAVCRWVSRLYDKKSGVSFEYASFHYHEGSTLTHNTKMVLTDDEEDLITSLLEKLKTKKMSEAAAEAKAIREENARIERERDREERDRLSKFFE